MSSKWDLEIIALIKKENIHPLKKIISQVMIYRKQCFMMVLLQGGIPVLCVSIAFFL